MIHADDIAPVNRCEKTDSAQLIRAYSKLPEAPAWDIVSPAPALRASGVAELIAAGLLLLHLAVVVAVVAVRVVQVAVDQVVGVVAVRHRFVAAAGTVAVALVVTAAGVLRGAIGRVGRADLDRMALDAAFAHVVQVAVVQVIDVVAVLDGGVAAGWAMLVVVILVNLVLAHFFPSFRFEVLRDAGPCRGASDSAAWAMALFSSSRTCRSARA
jgi:hypothetical protein